MTRFRARLWGAASWTYIDVAEEEDDGVEEAVSSILGSALSTSSLHVQGWSDADDRWENLE